MCVKINPIISMIVYSRTLTLFESAIKSPETKKNYTYSLHEFMKFIKINEYDDIPKLGSKKILNFLKDWVIHLRNKQLKANTIRAKLCSIELLLEMNDILINKKILHKLLPSSDYVQGGGTPFTTEEIQRMLKSTTRLRSKALVHYFASTGARPASITDPVLRLKHIEEMSQDCKAVRIYDGSKDGYWAFLTPEASQALDHYLKSRKLNGENLTQESPVFANYNKPNPTMKNDYLSEKSVRIIMKNLIKASGIERTKDGNRFDKAPVYGFRKRFNTILKLNNDVNYNVAEKLMAHKNGLDGSYLKPTKEQCFTEFAKAISELTISDEARHKVRITKLEQEKSQIVHLNDEVSKLKDLMEKQINTRTAIAAFYERGDIESLKNVDPNLLEVLELWKPLKAQGKIPDTFKYSKEQLDNLKKINPKYYQHIVQGKKIVLGN